VREIAARFDDELARTACALEVEAQVGEIAVETRVGAGSTFRVTLPLEAAAAAASEAGASAPSARGVFSVRRAARARTARGGPPADR